MSKTTNSNKLWGGRFKEDNEAIVKRFTSSIQFDHKLATQDIMVSLAHAQMLHKIGILKESELEKINLGLEKISEEIESKTFPWSEDLEDVHMNIESRLTDLIGIAGKKLHTARSRNDQVATDIRLYLREAIDEIKIELRKLQISIITLARSNATTIMPGFTHLQAAQPIIFGHHLLAWNEMLDRDYCRLVDCLHRLNECPLGSAALAGTSFPIDRHMTSELLRFNKPTENSMDGVSDRDFGVEFCSFSALLMTHLSRISEEIILWMSQQFDFISIPDSFCTGSSIMPQKKNPDVPELIRGKSGRVTGNLISLLTLIKSQPLAYNKDNQEDKEPIFDTVETILSSLRIFSQMVPGIKPNIEKMFESASIGHSTATDLAEYLVRKGIAFRDAHQAVGGIVALAVERNISIDKIELSVLQSFCSNIQEDVFDVITLEGSVKSRNHFGATSPEQVEAAAQRALRRLEARGKEDC